MSDNWNDRATRTWEPPSELMRKAQRGHRDNFGTPEVMLNEAAFKEAMERIAEMEAQPLAEAFMRAEQRVQQVEAENRALREREALLMAWVTSRQELDEERRSRPLIDLDSSEFDRKGVAAPRGDGHLDSRTAGTHLVEQKGRSDMARIPSIEESTGEGFVVPDMGAYTARLQAVEDAGRSKKYGNLQELFKWELVDEGPFKGEVIYDWVNVETFYDGKGKSPKPARLYNITKALMGANFNPKRPPADTQDLVGLECRILLSHWEKDDGTVKPQIDKYGAISRAATPEPEPEPEPEMTVDDIPF